MPYCLLAMFKKHGDYLKAMITNPGNIDFENKYEDKILIFNPISHTMGIIVSYDGSNSFCSGPNLEISLICTRPKQFGPDQNNL